MEETGSICNQETVVESSGEVAEAVLAVELAHANQAGGIRYGV